MAIYHFEAKVIGRTSGPGIIAAAAYRAGEKILDEKAEKQHNYKPRKGVLYAEIISPKNTPDWVYDRSKLWNEVESTEKRKDSQLAREILVALPSELNQEQRVSLLRGYIRQQFTKKGMVADFAIHAPSKIGDDRNYHAHILLTMRNITLEGFGGKVREWNAKPNIFQWRKAWEDHTNRALEQAGFDCRVDCRSHATKELDREPRLHLGYQAMSMERTGEQSDRGNENRAIEARNEMKANLCREQTLTGDELDDDQQSTLEIDDTEPLDCTIEIITSDEMISDPDQVQLLFESMLNLDENQSLSFDERKAALERNANTFEERMVELASQIKNASDKKTQDRLQLQERLESAYFKEKYNNALGRALTKEDSIAHLKNITICENKAKKAGKDYQKYVSEWNYHAVKDDRYVPIDKKSLDKINDMKAAETKKWCEFAVKAEKNGWSTSRIEKERQIVQKTLDQELALSFGLEPSFGYEREGMGM